MSEDAIRAAVKKAFPDGAGELSPLTGGMSGALVFGFEAEGQRWVARHSPFQGTERLRIGSESGAGPKLRYVDVPSEIAIMEHFEGVPAPGARDPASRKAVADAVRRIHHGPAFPDDAGGLRSRSTADFYAAIAEQYVKRSGEELPPALTELLTDCIERSKGSPTAPCHRDLNPGNILVSPDARVCILDWDSAGEGDPFLDIAQLCIFFAPSPPARAAFLRDYFERDATSDEIARLDEAHIYALTSYALAFAYMLATSGKKLRAEARPLPEVFMHLAQHGHAADADLVSASFLAEAQRLSRAREDRSSAG